jgi:hypothetical protein
MRPSPAAVLCLALLLCSHTQPVACGRKPRPAGSGGKTGDGLEASDSVANQTEVAAPAAKRPFTGVWLQRHFVNTTYYDQALCNDNSPRACWPPEVVGARVRGGVPLFATLWAGPRPTSNNSGAGRARHTRHCHSHSQLGSRTAGSETRNPLRSALPGRAVRAGRACADLGLPHTRPTACVCESALTRPCLSPAWPPPQRCSTTPPPPARTGPASGSSGSRGGAGAGPPSPAPTG